MLPGGRTNEQAALQEYVIDILEEVGPIARYRVMSMMSMSDDAELLTAERLYRGERFVRLLLGSLWDQLEPVGERRWPASSSSRIE